MFKLSIHHMVLIFSVLFALILLLCQEDSDGILQSLRIYSSSKGIDSAPIRNRKPSILQRFSNVYRRTYQKYSGSPKIIRDISFWMRSLQIYSRLAISYPIIMIHNLKQLHSS